MERMNELLEGVVGFVDITGYSRTANHQHFFLSFDVVHGINSDFKNHLVLPFLYHLQNWTSLEMVMLWKDVFECVAAAALPGKRIAVATTDNGTNSMIKEMRDGGVIRWPCAAVHMLNRVIKNTMKRVNNGNVDLLPRVLRAV